MINPFDVIKATEQAFHLRKGFILSKSRKPRTSEARAVAIYISVKMTELSPNELAEYYFNIDRTSVLYAVKRINVIVSKGLRTDTYCAVENLLETFNN